MGYTVAATRTSVKAAAVLNRLSLVVASSVCSPVASCQIPVSPVKTFDIFSFSSVFYSFKYPVIFDGAEFVSGNRTIPRAAVSHLAAA
jgi:hypothetical protein